MFGNVKIKPAEKIVKWWKKIVGKNRDRFAQSTFTAQQIKKKHNFILVFSPFNINLSYIISIITTANLSQPH